MMMLMLTMMMMLLSPWESAMPWHTMALLLLMLLMLLSPRCAHCWEALMTIHGDHDRSGAKWDTNLMNYSMRSVIIWLLLWSLRVIIGCIDDPQEGHFGLIIVATYWRPWANMIWCNGNYTSIVTTTLSSYCWVDEIFYLKAGQSLGPGLVGWGQNMINIPVPDFDILT